MKYIFCIYLFIGALWDIRMQKLPGIWLWSGCVVGGVYASLQIIGGERSLENLILSLLPGILCYIFAKISGAMGEGDAWVIITAGLCLRFHELAKVLLAAFFLSAVGSILYLILERNLKNRKIPFVPFLFLATGIIIAG